MANDEHRDHVERISAAWTPEKREREAGKIAFKAKDEQTRISEYVGHLRALASGAVSDAEFEACRIDLRWAQDAEKDDYRDGLKKKMEGDEDEGYNQIRDIQGHNPPVQLHWDRCRAADLNRWWRMAFEEFRP